jgi:hypothetical protein
VNYRSLHGQRFGGVALHYATVDEPERGDVKRERMAVL